MTGDPTHGAPSADSSPPSADSSPPSAASSPPRPASTVVLVRPGPAGIEVLLTHRPSTMDFGPGLHVFPGGGLEVADSDPGLLERLRGPVIGADGHEPPTHAGAFAIAAIRELYEEAGTLLATGPDGATARPGPVGATARPGPVGATARPGPVGRSPGSPARGESFAELVHRRDLALRGDWLVPLSRWVTPPGMSRRYDTRFFVAPLPDGIEIAIDRREVAAHEWSTPRDALAAMAEGRITLWPPTSTTLQQLAPARDLDDIRSRLAPEAEAGPPVVEPLGRAVVRITLRAAGGIPGQAVCAYLVGRRRLVVVDPGDPGDEAAEAILATAAAHGARIIGILLTAPVPDHAAGAESLAFRLDVPILAAAGARRVLPGELLPLADGDAVDVADVAIRAIATPGTNPDHLAFEVPEAGVVLVGDLEGPGPSRTIPDAVDVDALARSRARLESLGHPLRLAAHAPR